MAYLDSTGLAYFWGKIKAYVAALLAPKADDSNVVHKTGDETIAGRKTFRQTGDVDQGHASSYTVFRNASFDRTAPAANTKYYNELIFGDADNAIAAYNSSGRMGTLGYVVDTATGDSFCEIVSRYYKSGTSFENYLSRLSVGFQSDGTRYASAPSTPDTSARNDDSDILTRNWIPRDTRIVHTTGNETINDKKTFTGSPHISANYGCLYRTVSNYTAAQIPGALNWLGGFIWQDKNSRFIAGVEPYIDSTYLNLNIALTGCDSTGGYKAGVVLSMQHTGGAETCRPQYNNQMTLGDGTYRWKQLFAVTATINTSDERFKSGIAPLPETVLDAWEDVDWIQFQFRDAVAEKGAGARLHAGLIAQRVAEAFSRRGLDESRYAFFCHDVWDAVPETRSPEGSVTPARDAGDVYSVRYEEALCMEAAYMRRENARLKKRVADLEERLAALELKVS